MATIRRYSNRYKDYVIWFTLSNGKTYYIGEGFIFIPISENITFDELKKRARKYTYLGSKRMHKMIWNKYFNSANEKDNGGHVIKSSCYPLVCIEKQLKYYVNGTYYFNHTL